MRMGIAEPHRTKKIKEQWWNGPTGPRHGLIPGSVPQEWAGTPSSSSELDGTVYPLLPGALVSNPSSSSWLGCSWEQVDTVSIISLWLDPNIKSSLQHLPGKGLSTHLRPQPLLLTPKGGTLQSPHPNNQGTQPTWVPQDYVIQKNQFSLVTHRPKEKGWKRQFKEMEKNVGVTVVVSDKIDCKPKHVTRDKGGHSITTNNSSRK